MSFGFSIGDFLAAAQLAHKIRKDFSGAPSQFKSLSDETKLLSMVLQDVDVKVDETDLTPQQETNLEQAMSTCEAVLHDLQTVCDNFSDLDTSQGHSRKSIRRVWKKLKWEPNEARELRERISSSISMLTALLNQLSSETTVAVKKGVDRLNEGQDRQERLDILNWLSSFDHMAQQNDISARRQAGTGLWLLESREFVSWKTSKGKTLYCPGIPGAGKTILSSVVVEELTKQFQHDSSVCIAHIYFNYQQQENQTIDQVFGNLLRQLAADQSNIPDAVQDIYKEHSKKGSKLKFEEIFKILHGLSALYSRVFIIVDALDECPSRDGRRNTMLSEIMKLQSALSANILCTSRPIPEIESWFPNAVSINVRASEHDVRKYLDGKIGRLPSFVARSTELQENVKTQILQVVDGMFLLAHLHLESLMYKRTAKALRTALEGLPRGSTACDDTYERTMRRIETQSPDQAGLAMDVLQWIVYAKDPLPVLGLQHALAVESGEEDLDFDNLPDADDMVTACGGLVTIDQASGIIRLVHYTTQEYFERTKEAWFPVAEEQMAEVCLTYLSFLPFRGEQCKTWYEYWMRLEDWPFYRYAGRYWGFHAHQTSPARILAFFQLKQAFQSSLQPLFRKSPWHREKFYPFDPVKRKVTMLHVAALFGLGAIVRELATPETVEKRTEERWTPLAMAAEQGHDEVIRLLLLEHGADAEIYEEGYMLPFGQALARTRFFASSCKVLLEVGKATVGLWRNDPRFPLYLATLNDDPEVIECFLQKIETFQDHESELGLILRTAAVCGNVGVVKRLVSRPHLNLNISGHIMPFYNDTTRRPPLTWATYYGAYEVSKILVETGRIDPNMVDSNGRTALSYALNRNMTKMVDFLLKINDIYVDSAELAYYRWPLSFAVARRNKEMAKKIISTNREYLNAELLRMAILNKDQTLAIALLSSCVFDIDTKDGRERSPISYAAERGYEGVVEALLRSNADVNSRGPREMTPLSYAAQRGHEQIVKALLQVPYIEVDSKAEGRTPLSLAAQQGHARIVQRLLDTGQVDPDSKSSIESLHQTPLTWAVEGCSGMDRNYEGHAAVVDLLLKTKRVDVNSKSIALRSDDPNNAREDQTPLLVATGQQVPLSIVRLLVENGADVNSRSEDGTTPLSNALRFGDKATIDLLLAHGAKLQM
ncbi:NACHT domain-containing protein [Fusarium sp. LHS14.1]|nr:NACHT domain-containing protein [Fusarium sp. LHS14.1]